MEKIALVGDRTSIEFFAAFGADVFPAETADDALRILNAMQWDTYANIYITEDVFDQSRFSPHLKTRKLTVIPSLKGREGKGFALMESLMGKATGMREGKE